MLELHGLHLGVPNDIFSGSARRISTALGEREVRSPGDDTIHSLRQWACVDGVLGVVGVFGASELELVRQRRRLGGRFESLFVDEIAYPARLGPTRAQPGEELLDVGWLILSGTDAAETASVASTTIADLAAAHAGVRAMRVTGADGRRYFVGANLGDGTAELTVPGSPIVAAAESGLLGAGEVVVSVLEAGV